MSEELLERLIARVEAAFAAVDTRIVQLGAGVTLATNRIGLVEEELSKNRQETAAGSASIAVVANAVLRLASEISDLRESVSSQIVTEVKKSTHVTHTIEELAGFRPEDERQRQ